MNKEARALVSIARTIMRVEAPDTTPTTLAACSMFVARAHSVLITATSADANEATVRLARQYNIGVPV